MLLSELFDRLALGELSQHKYGRSGAIVEADRPALIHQLNLGLTKLFTLFPLLEKELVIEQQTDTQEYVLTDLVSDLLQVNRAYNAEGEPVPLNDEKQDGAWFLPTWNVLQIPYPVASTSAVLLYQAHHPKIATDAALTTELEIPYCLEEALQAYIASRCFIALGNQSSGALSSYFSGKFNEQIAYVQRHNLISTDTRNSNVKLTLKGFI
jgi:hypothetical protein